MKRRKDWIAVLASALLLAGIFGGVGTCTVYRWKECRRVHPWWYCASEGGK